MWLKSVVLGAPDPKALAVFYQQLLGWKITVDEPGWVKLRPDGSESGAPESGTGLAFQLETGHVPPVWPSGEGDQQMQVHLDIAVDDLEEAGRLAVAAGAKLADFQPQDDVRVYLDPAGHPFCLFVSG